MPSRPYHPLEDFGWFIINQKFPSDYYWDKKEYYKLFERFLKFSRRKVYDWLQPNQLEKYIALEMIVSREDQLPFRVEFAEICNTVLSKFLDYAGQRLRDYQENVKLPERLTAMNKEQFLSNDEVCRLIKEAENNGGQRDKVIVQIMIELGCSTRELSLFKIKHLDLYQMRLQFQTRHRSWVCLPLYCDLLYTLATFITNRQDLTPNDPLVIDQDGHEMTPRGVRDVVKKYLRRIGRDATRWKEIITNTCESRYFEHGGTEDGFALVRDRSRTSIVKGTETYIFAYLGDEIHMPRFSTGSDFHPLDKPYKPTSGIGRHRRRF